jgi:hypothetical protein
VVSLTLVSDIVKRRVERVEWRATPGVRWWAGVGGGARRGRAGKGVGGAGERITRTGTRRANDSPPKDTRR